MSTDQSDLPDNKDFPWLRLLQVLLDALLCTLAIAGAYIIRFEGKLSILYFQQLMLVVPPLVALRLAVNWKFGVYGRLWRYT